MVLPKGVTRTLFVALSKVLCLRLLALEADLDGGTRLGWASAYGTLVQAMDCTLIPPLALQRSGGVTASGAILTAHASSLTQVFLGVGLTGYGISPRLKVELEPVYRVSSLLAMAH